MTTDQRSDHDRPDNPSWLGTSVAFLTVMITLAAVLLL